MSACLHAHLAPHAHHTNTHPHTTHTHSPHIDACTQQQCVSWSYFVFQIFELILKVRANESGHIGMEDGDKPIVYTPFIVCGPRPKGPRPAPPILLSSVHKLASGQRLGTMEVLRLDYNQSYDALLLCLQRVRPWW